MARMPRRAVLRLIVQDAIDDRRGLRDPSTADETRASIASYRALRERLADDAPPMDDAARALLAAACGHARIWREGLVAAVRHTRDRAMIHDARSQVEEVDRAERALGLVRVDPFAGTRSVGIAELRMRATASYPQS